MKFDTDFFKPVQEIQVSLKSVKNRKRIPIYIFHHISLSSS
jgi:hypothetical protein